MKAVILACAVVLLASCSPFGLNPMGYRELNMPLDEAWLRVSAMEYQHEEKPYAKSYIEFMRDGGGDCEDFATALIYLLGPESSAVAIDAPIKNHCIVKYRNLYIEPMQYDCYYYEDEIVISATYSYDEVMFMSTGWGAKGL